MQFDEYFDLLLDTYDSQRTLTSKKCTLMASKLEMLFQRTPPHEEKHNLLKRLQGLFDPKTLKKFLTIHLTLQRGKTPQLNYQERDDYYEVGCAYMNWQDFAPAARIFCLLINENPDEPRNYYAYGMCALQLDQLEEAFSAFYRCYKNNPDSMRGFSLIIETLLKLDEKETTALALEHLDANFSSHPNYSQIACRYHSLRATLPEPQGVLEDHLLTIHQARCPNG